MTNETPVPTLTPEQVRIALRLESIFMPQAKRQRDSAYAQLRPGKETGDDLLRFVHYTSAEAALAIIRSKRMWMRNTTCMADYREVQHGFDILNKFFSDTVKTTAFISALDACVPNAAQEAIELFNQRWNDIRFSTYVASISEHDAREDSHGRLSMWRAFGGKAVRVALVFKVPHFSQGALALNLLFSPVAYLMEDEAHAVLHEIVKNINASHDFLRSVDRAIVIQTVFYMLVAAVTCLKHEGFREEREWRAIYTPNLRPSPLMESSVEVVAGVPQIVHKIPLDANKSAVLADLDLVQIFDRLIIGPSSYPWAMFHAFTAELARAGVPDAADRVWNSNIPLRA
jgi:Protein of unknown function (DUF2971)